MSRSYSSGVLHEGSVRSQLGFRGSPPKREGESHPRLSDVARYNAAYTEAISLGFSLGEALDHAERAARTAQEN